MNDNKNSKSLLSEEKFDRFVQINNLNLRIIRESDICIKTTWIDREKRLSIHDVLEQVKALHGDGWKPDVLNYGLGWHELTFVREESGI